MSLCTLSWIVWDPPRELFVIPFIDRPVYWYGFLFVCGFIIGYRMVVPMLARKLVASSLLSKDDGQKQAHQLADLLLWFVVIGTIVGARIGHVLFYNWPQYQHRPLDIFKIWEGGLASHGGTVGVIIALLCWLYLAKKKDPSFSFINIMDIVVVPAALTAFFIRLGNFFNQEILGTPSTLPWAIVFGHPADGSFPLARHPAQLYEGVVYLAAFFLLVCLWKKNFDVTRPGLMSGIFFIIVFGARFLIEFIKEHQSLVIDESFLQMGQLLSLPFILLGAILVAKGTKGTKGT